MKLHLRFLLLMTVVFVSFMVITWLLSRQMMEHLNQEWGEQFTQRQVMFDKFRTLAPLLREIALARQMAAEPAIVEMALHENDPVARRRGIEAMEKYRFNFRDHSYFAAFARSGNYYFNDAANQYAGRQLRYVLSPSSAKDKWFYATIAEGKEYQVNLDPDVHLNVTKAWINVLVRKGNETLGVIGTGIDLTDLIKLTVSDTQPGVENLFIDQSMAIQLNHDPALIDYMTIAKSEGERLKVNVLLNNPADIEQLRMAMVRLENAPSNTAILWVDYKGDRRMLGVAYLPEIGWYDLTVMDKHGINLFADLAMGPLLFGLALLLALLSVGLALQHWILRPIAILHGATERIRRGDYRVDEPLHGSGEIAELSRSFASMAHAVIDSNRQLEEKVHERTADLERLAEVDPLTGLFNRRGMLERFEKEIARQARVGHELGLLLLDLDHFKQINDTYGHAAGDLALCEVARVVQAVKRSYDHAARWGGEEFLVLLPGCSRESMLLIAERMREAIGALEIETAGQRIRFTASIGALHPETPQTLDAMLNKVDAALYAAKAAGRNCVRMAD